MAQSNLAAALPLAEPVAFDVVRFEDDALTLTSTVVEISKAGSALDYWREHDALLACVRRLDTPAPTVREAIDAMVLGTVGAGGLSGGVLEQLRKMDTRAGYVQVVEAEEVARLALQLPSNVLLATALRGRDQMEREARSHWNALAHGCSFAAAEEAATAIRSELASIERAAAAIRDEMESTSLQAAFMVRLPSLQISRDLEAQLDALQRQIAQRAAPEAAMSAADAAVLDATRQLRDRLLFDEAWWSAAEVAQYALDGAPPSNASQPAARLRKERRLLGARFKGEYRHPRFQFSDSGALHPRMRDLLKRLPADDTGWPAVFWCFQPTGHLLDETDRPRRPADVFQSDPDAVIDAAEKDFGDGDGDW